MASLLIAGLTQLERTLKLSHHYIANIRRAKRSHGKPTVGSPPSERRKDVCILVLDAEHEPVSVA